MEYTVCGVVVHVGTNPERGHYVAFVKTSNGWPMIHRNYKK